MSPPERRPTIDDLLGHAPWVARLARALVGGSGPWPDVVQETWLAAVQRPPESGQNLRGWLGRVITNAANQMRRSESRRLGREERAAVAEVTRVAPDDVVARAELERRVASAVMELAEPYRTTILLRYFEGLPGPEIARRTGVTDSAARTRLERGLERLRERFDREEPGGRAAWCALLAPVAGGATGAGVGGGTLLAGAGALAAIVVTIAVLSTRSDTSGSSAPPTPLRSPAVPATASLESGPTRATAAPAADAESSGRDRSIRGTVRDVEGRPITGVSVAFLTYDVAIDSESYFESLRAVTDTSGEFVVAEPPEFKGIVILEATARGYCPKRRRLDLEANRHDLVLDPAGTIHGTLRAAETGAAIVGATIHVFGRAPDDFDWCMTTSGPAGEFVLEPVALTRVTTLEIEREGYVRFVFDLFPPSESLERRDIHVPEGLSVRGVVVDGRTGSPVGGAAVLANGWPVTRCDVSGEFTLRGICESWCSLSVESQGYAATRTDVGLEAGGSAAPLVVPLVRGGCVAGVVRGPDGRPVEGAIVRPGGPGFRADAGREDLSAAGADVERYFIDAGATYADRSVTDADGRFQLDGMPPGETALKVAVDGFAETRVTCRVGSDEVTTVEIPLVIEAVVEGVVRLNGQPLRGGLIRVDEKAFRIGADGGYRVHGITPGEIVMTVHRGQAIARLGEAVSVRAMPGQVSRRDIDVYLTTTPITGTVVDSAGTPQASVVVAAWGPDSETIRAETDESGRFRLDMPVRPGDPCRLKAGNPRRPTLVDVAAGATDVKVILTETSFVWLRAVDAKTGLPLPMCSVLSYEVGRGYHPVSGGSSSPDGTYRVVVPDEGERYSISAPALGFAPVFANLEQAAAAVSVDRALVVELSRGVELTIHWSSGGEGPSAPETRVVLATEDQVEDWDLPEDSPYPELRREPRSAIVPEQFVGLAHTETVTVRGLPPGVYRLVEPAETLRFDPPEIVVPEGALRHVVDVRFEPR